MKTKRNALAFIVLTIILSASLADGAGENNHIHSYYHSVPLSGYGTVPSDQSITKP